MPSLRKWYFDCLTPENDYLFVYYALVGIAGLTFRTVTVHLARTSKNVLQTRAFALPGKAEPSRLSDGCILQTAGGGIRSHTNGFALSFCEGDCSLSLNYATTAQFDVQPIVIPAGGGKSVRWKPLGLNYRVTGQVTLAGEQLNFEGVDGYADYLEANCFPRSFPVRTLFWGRLAHPKVSLVYVRAEGRTGGHAWSGLFGRAGEVVLESRNVEINSPASRLPPGSATSAPAIYSVSAAAAAGRINVIVHHDVAVQSGGFIDQQDSMSALSRWLLKALMRNPQSTKSISRADVDVELKDVSVRQSQIPFIDEYVTF